MPKYLSTRAIVINKKRRGEGDLLTTLYTKDLGKIICLAKGAQSIKSRRLGHLEIGSVIKVSLYQKDDFLWLAESESELSFLEHSEALIQINLLFYFLEIANSLLPQNQASPEIFGIIVGVIESISQNRLRSFIKNEIVFLEKLGYGVPREILQNYNQADYKNTQRLIKAFCESIIERPLTSSQLFS